MLYSNKQKVRWWKQVSEQLPKAGFWELSTALGAVGPLFTASLRPLGWAVARRVAAKPRQLGRQRWAFDESASVEWRGSR